MFGCFACYLICLVGWLACWLLVFVFAFVWLVGGWVSFLVVCLGRLFCAFGWLVWFVCVFVWLVG